MGASAMGDVAAIALSVGLPWLAGTLSALALQRGAPRPSLLLAVGYGYLIGALATTLLMRALDLLAVRWTLGLLGVGLAALAVGGYVACRAAPTPSLRQRWRDGAATLAAAAPSQRAVFWFFLALIVVRLSGLALELIWRPLLPWDAWAHWATKSRVWYEYGQLAAFISPGQWLNSGTLMQFFDTHSDYPATVPLLQVWTALCLGRWDESLMNAPWLAVMVALGFAFYAQLRRLGASAAESMLITYLLLSLPFLDVHVALAGYADIFVATAYGLAAMSFWQWARGRARSDALLAVLLAIVCIVLKKEGILWVLTLIPPVIVAINRRVGFGLVIVLAAAVIAYLLFGPSELRVLGYLLRTDFSNVTGPLTEHFFVMDNWHLLWYATVVVLALNYRHLFEPGTAPMTVTMLGALAFVFVVFFYSSAAGGVEDATLVNRLPLHMVPALAFYLVLVWRRSGVAAAATQAEPVAAPPSA